MEVLGAAGEHLAPAQQHGSARPQAEVPGTAELGFCLRWGPTSPPFNRDNRAAENRFVVEKNPRVQCALK